MSGAESQNLFSNEQINFAEIIAVLWSRKWLIVILTIVAAISSVAFALSRPNIYTASALLSPSEQSGSGISGLMKQYGGLASLAGISIPQSQDGSRAQLAIQLLKSRAFIGDFVERHAVLPELMAVKSWDIVSGDLTYDPKIFDDNTGTWVRDVEFPQTAQPSRLEAFKEFMEIMEVKEDPRTGYVLLSVDHMSPEIAAKWVALLIKDINNVVKAQEVDEAKKSIDYLKEQAEATALRELQAVFFELIQSQTETVMLAEVRQEYVFKTIDPPFIPEEKSGPNRALICIIGTLIGGILGIIWVLAQHHRQRGVRNSAI